MRNEDKKYLGFLIVFLEVMLAGCLVLLSFIYGIWFQNAEFAAEITLTEKLMEACKRQLAITIAGLLAAWFIHILNTYWIIRTGSGSIRNSFVFSRGMFIMIFLAGLVGVVLFLFQSQVF